MGEVASIIAAIAFAVLVLFLALPLWKLARLFDQMRQSVREVSVSADQTVQELNATVRDAHAQLVHIDTVTASTARVAQDISAVSTLVSSSVARPLIALVAFGRTVTGYFGGRKHAHMRPHNGTHAAANTAAASPIEHATDGATPAKAAPGVATKTAAK